MSPSTDPEVVVAGRPITPPAITLDMFGTQYLVMHGANIYVEHQPSMNCALVAIGRPDMVGLFMGLNAEQARKAGEWLTAAADALDAAA